MSAPTTIPQQQMAAHVAKQRAASAAEQVLRDAMQATHSPSDRAAYALDLWLIKHPEVAVSSDDDYPGWVPGLPACPPRDTTGGQP